MTTESRQHTVLIIDDDRLLCQMASEFLTSDEIKVMVAHTGKDGLDLCARNHVDVVLLDQKLPDGEGCDFCPRIIGHSENAKIIFITAFPSFKNALKAIENGAFSYLTKPFDLAELKLAIGKCLRMNELERTEESVRYQNALDTTRGLLAGEGEGPADVREMIATAAGSSAPVLITGETGSGKSRIAKLIHARSGRHGPFMAINCAALPENLVESELFGHEKGAFSGAQAVKKGLLEIAENGSLLLDEIGEMSVHLQAKLLGVLDEMRIRRVGGVVFHPVRARVMAATNCILEDKIRSREFREDLFYRLNVLRIHLPPLRERKEEIPRLARAFLGEMAPQRGLRLGDPDLERMGTYPWPGNIRELRNVIERAIIRAGADGELRVTPLLSGGENGLKAQAAQETGGEILPLDAVERRHIDSVLKKKGGNLAQTAKALGISLNTLKRKLRPPA